MNRFYFIRIIFLAFVYALSSSVVGAPLERASWLSDTGQAGVRLLACSYDGPVLRACREAGPSSDWQAEHVSRAEADGAVLHELVFTACRDMDNCGVAVAFDRSGWSSDNYVLLPASVYNGNRQRIVNRRYATGLDATDYGREDLALTSNPIPQLSPEFGAVSRLEVMACNTATPAMAFLERRTGRGTILLTEQGIERDGRVLDHSLIVEESADRSRATFVIGAPGVRQRKPEFIGFSASPDRGIRVTRGERIRIRVLEIGFDCASVPELLDRFLTERKRLSGHGAPRNLLPMSRVFELMTRNIEERFHQGPLGAYYCPENADWMSYGWIGGLMNTYPMLALGDTMHVRRVASTFDFALPRATGRAGYFYDTLGEDGQVLRRDAGQQQKDICLTRKNADVLYWMVKQFNLMHRMGCPVDTMWENRVRRLADAFVATWKKHGTWGNYLRPETGDVAVYNTTGGAMAVGGLALAARYFNNPEYLRTALESAARYYAGFALTGFTSGGCGDILQNADSETAAALMTSLMTLYEATGDRTFLQQAGHLAALCATWTVSYRYVLPLQTPLGRLGADLTGSVWASTQNKHGAPGFCTQSGDALFKLYRATGDVRYAELLRDIIHAHAEGIQPNGKITERLTYCDADSRGSRLDGGKTGWNETNGALMALEIPGIYLRTDTDCLYVFDHVAVERVERRDGRVKLSLTNPTPHDALVTVVAEDGTAAARPLGDNAFMDWTVRIAVKAGATRTVTLPVKDKPNKRNKR